VPLLTEGHEQVGGGGETDNSTGVSVEQTLSRGGRTEHTVKDEEAPEHAEEANPEEELGEVGKISHGEIGFGSEKKDFCVMDREALYRFARIQGNQSESKLRNHGVRI
jgi:hypothetical protein